MIGKNVEIIQLDLDHGTQWGDQEVVKFLREICIPSVKNYCEKNNYNHKLITQSIYSSRGGNFEFLSKTSKHYSFERYFHLKDSEFDNIVYIDNDVYIFEKARPLPNITGLMNAREPKSDISNLFKTENQLKEEKYYNSGVTFCDKKTALNLSDYMLTRMKKNERAKIKNTDNMMLNEYIINNDHLFSEIGNEWNYMPFLPNSPKIPSPNFFHFVGIQGKEIIKMIIQNKFNIEDFLLNAEFKYDNNC